MKTYKFVIYNTDELRDVLVIMRGRQWWIEGSKEKGKMSDIAKYSRDFDDIAQMTLQTKRSV